MPKIERCPWSQSHELLAHYHDTEWGVQRRDDRALFAALILDGFQAGLSWLTILKKREAFRRAFDNFDEQKMARYNDKKLEALMQDEGIIRNRQKISAARGNAQALIALREATGVSFSDYIWGFVDGRPQLNRWKEDSQIPAETELSRRMSKDLLKRGFKFVGPTIVYAFLQSSGVVNDHLVDCPRHKACCG